jgi:DNA-binding transcriptional MerR regulator
MKPGEVANYLGIGRSTVTTWTNGEFKDYFTPGAQGGQDRPRVFTELDIRIMYLIKLRKDQNVAADRIHTELKNLRDHDWEGLPDLPAAQTVQSVPVVPVAAADAALSAERRALLREIALLNERIDTLEGELRERRGDQEKYLREIADIGRKLAASETELQLWRSGRLKGEND